MQTDQRNTRAGSFGAGYAYDRSEGSLLSEFAPERLHLATTSGSQATGDGVRLGQAAGATLVDMDQVQVPVTTLDPCLFIAIYRIPLARCRSHAMSRDTAIYSLAVVMLGYDMRKTVTISPHCAVTYHDNGTLL